MAGRKTLGNWQAEWKWRLMQYPQNTKAPFSCQKEMHQWRCKEGASTPDKLQWGLIPYPLSPGPFSLQSQPLCPRRVWLHSSVRLTMSKHMTFRWPLSSPEGSKAPSYERGKQTKPALHGSISKRFRSTQADLEPLLSHLFQSMDLKLNGHAKMVLTKEGQACGTQNTTPSTW